VLWVSYAPPPPPQASQQASKRGNINALDKNCSFEEKKFLLLRQIYGHNMFQIIRANPIGFWVKYYKIFMAVIYECSE
jgi:hypothetical protein